MKFYGDCFGLALSHRLDFPGFTLIYLRDPESGFEIELTHNVDRTEPYTHGNGYGHIAIVTDDLASLHEKLTTLGYAPAAIKEFKRDDTLLARFFFVVDPDGYKIEALEKWGHYQ